MTVITSDEALWLLLYLNHATCVECVLDSAVRCRGLRERKLRSMLGGNVALLSKRERHAVAELLQEHAYLFNNWPPPGAHPCLVLGVFSGQEGIQLPVPDSWLHQAGSNQRGWLPCAHAVLPQISLFQVSGQ